MVICSYLIRCDEIKYHERSKPRPRTSVIRGPCLSQVFCYRQSYCIFCMYEKTILIQYWNVNWAIHVEVILDYWLRVHFASGKCIPWADQGMLCGRYDRSISVNVRPSNISRYDCSFSPSKLRVTRTPSSSDLGSGFTMNDISLV